MGACAPNGPRVHPLVHTILLHINTKTHIYWHLVFIPTFGDDLWRYKYKVKESLLATILLIVIIEGFWVRLCHWWKIGSERDETLRLKVLDTSFNILEDINCIIFNYWNWDYLSRFKISKIIWLLIIIFSSCVRHMCILC